MQHERPQKFCAADIPDMRTDKPVSGKEHPGGSIPGNSADSRRKFLGEKKNGRTHIRRDRYPVRPDGTVLSDGKNMKSKIFFVAYHELSKCHGKTHREKIYVESHSGGSYNVQTE